MWGAECAQEGDGRGILEAEMFDKSSLEKNGKLGVALPFIYLRQLQGFSFVVCMSPITRVQT